MINKLHNQGIFSLKDTSIVDLYKIGRSDWKSAEMLKMEGVEVDIWHSYVAALKPNFILLNEEEEDYLFWSRDDKCGTFSAKKGYKVLAKEAFEGEVLWWWKFIWDQMLLIKYKILLWVTMENKVLTWDNEVKRGWCGPNRCSLCK
jgi:hypothetical protein